MGQSQGLGAMAQESGDQNTAHMKGKLQNLNETVRHLTENLNVHKKEV